MKFLLGHHFIPLDADLGLEHKRRFTGPNAGEMAFAYMFGYLLLFLAGAGRYSLARLLGL